MNRMLAVALLGLSLSAPAGATTLREAAAAALNSDPRAAALQSAVDAAGAQREMALAGFRPNVLFSGEIGRMDLQTDALFPESGARNPNGLTLALSQPLYSGGRNRAQLAAADAGLDASRQRASSETQQLMLEAIAAYLDVLRDRAVLDQAQASHRTLEAANTDTGKRFDAGEVTRTDVAQAQARAAESLAALAGAQARVRANEAAFERVTGLAPDALTPIGAPPVLPASLDEALRWAGESPIVAAAIAQARSARAQVNVASADHLPKVSIDAQANTRDNTEFGYDRLDTWSALLKLSVPIYQGGAVQAHVAQARAQAAQAGYAADDAQRAARQAAIQSWELWQAAQQAVPAYQAQVSAAELALSAVRKELEVGSRTTLDLLDAERERLSAHVNLVSSERDRALAAYRLLAACGHLRLDAIP